MKAQVVFKTIVPQHPVISGESFQVQYIIEDAEKPGSFRAPLFGNFRVVTGPNIYTGTVASGKGRVSLRNTVYTLVGLKTGMFVIPGATATVDGKMMKSNDVVVEVIPEEEANKRLGKEPRVGNSAYFLEPGEDAYEKIRQNLFLKVMVDKKNCFVGEPVLATFKLYSRLESRSDIVKNPGFYGFTVYDMINLADKQSAIEKVNGNSFDVHTIRKVQLYPLQAGVFTIDAMEIKNNVEFSKSVVNQKTEQEITEGVLNNNDPGSAGENTQTFETDIRTDPVVINVKPVPVKNKPAGFNGATGMFRMKALIEKNKLAKNEEGVFEISISGKGNFIQLSAPTVQWPAGIEAFEPVVRDSLDKTTSPLGGTRVFRYAFVSARPGEYMIPPVSFSFYNPDSGGFKTITTPPLKVSIGSNENIIPSGAKTADVKNADKGKNFWLIGGIAGLFTLCGSVWFYRSRQRRSGKIPIESVAPASGLSVEETLAPVFLWEKASGQNFYSSLHQAVWNFFGYHFNLSGSQMNKENLNTIMKKIQIPQNLIEETGHILKVCEAGMFTAVNVGADKGRFLEDAKRVLEKISEKIKDNS